MQDHPLFLRLITDIHVGEDRNDRIGTQAIQLMREFVAKANEDRPQAVIDMGDRVMQTSPSEDAKNLKKLSDEFNKLAVPHYHVHGNHDVLHLTRSVNQELLDMGADRSTSKDVGSYHLVFWNPGLEITQDGLTANRDDIAWLENTLLTTDRPCLVFTHVPLDNEAIENPKNRHERRLPYFANYPQNPFIRKIMEQSGKVVACFSGHRHLNTHAQINGIHYITLDSFVKRTKDNPNVPSGAYADLTIDREGNITFQVQGLEPVTRKFTKNPYI